MTLSECRVTVFAKTPVPGKVKTRLIPFLDPAEAASLYESMVFKCLATAKNSGIGPVELWCTPSTEHPFLRRCAEDFQVDLRLQPAGDIGVRMAAAFRETLKTATFSLLLGTDCPSVSEDDLRQAAAALRQGMDAVFIPTEDGGYCLAALRRSAPELFSGISWGTESVMEQTRGRLRQLHWAWYELAQRWDVDRPQDIERLRREGWFDQRETSPILGSRNAGRRNDGIRVEEEKADWPTEK